MADTTRPLETKTCAQCGAPFPRPGYAHGKLWAKQRYCSTTCSRAASAALRAGTGFRGQPLSKICEHCGEEFSKADNISRKVWEKRRYCAHRCAGDARTAATRSANPPRKCAVCEGEFWSKYRSRHHCGTPECAAAYREMANAEQSRRMRADYASGKRKRVDGLSPRERSIWPHLIEHGWSWRLRWTDADGTFELDFADPVQMLDVEIDGIEHAYTKRAALDADRDAILTARGWRILRIPNADVDTDLAGTVDRIRAWAGG